MGPHDATELKLGKGLKQLGTVLYSAQILTADSGQVNDGDGRIGPGRGQGASDGARL